MYPKFSCCFFAAKAFATGSSRAYVWGSSLSGQLGLGNKSNVTIPQELTDFKGKNITHLSCGETFSVAVQDEKILLYWGEDKPKINGGIDISKPRAINLNYPGKIKQIACGQFHTLLLMEDGSVLSFGGNHEGQLGHGNIQLEGNVTPIPTVIETLNGLRIKRIVSGGIHSLAISEQGELYSWGSSMFNQIGHGSPHLESTPKLVQGLKGKKIKKAAAGIYQSLVLTDSNELFAFGRNQYINGKRKNDFKIERIALPEKEEVADIKCGISSLYFLTKTGKLYSWGDNSEGQLGIENKSGSDPELITSLEKWKTVKMETGYYHCFAYCEGLKINRIVKRIDGNTSALFAWGLGGDYQLGNSLRGNKYIPIRIPFFDGKKIKEIAVGYSHSIVIVL